MLKDKIQKMLALPDEVLEQAYLVYLYDDEKYRKQIAPDKNRAKLAREMLSGENGLVHIKRFLIMLDYLESKLPQEQTKCRKCNKELWLKDVDAGSDAEIERLCNKCCEQQEQDLRRVFDKHTLRPPNQPVWFMSFRQFKQAVAELQQPKRFPSEGELIKECQQSIFNDGSLQFRAGFLACDAFYREKLKGGE